MSFVFAHPFRLAGNHFAVVDDASDGGLAQEIAIMATTRVGERPLVPDYGIIDPTFGSIDLADLNRGLTLYGPDDVVVTDMDIEIVDRSSQRVTLTFNSTPAAPSADDVSYD